MIAYTIMAIIYSIMQLHLAYFEANKSGEVSHCVGDQFGEAEFSKT